jgi:hypothetical protein
MRRYIHQITNRAHENKPTYDFTKSIEGAWHWTTRESVESDLHVISIANGGITVESPDGIGKSSPCTDFRIESRPQGGFAISCDNP